MAAGELGRSPRITHAPAVGPRAVPRRRAGSLPDRARCSTARMRAGSVSPSSSGSDGDGALEDDRPVVDALVDEVDGRAGHPHAVLERLPLRVQALERRQQRRVDVDDALREGVEQHAVSRAGRTPPGRRARRPRRGAPSTERRVVILAPRELAMVDDARRDAGCRRPLEAAHARAVRDHDADAAVRSVPAATRSRIACRLVPDPEISTPTASTATL